jgi:[CysO sulfur-carrier protein]-S-L-cysteine hydrolase
MTEFDGVFFKEIVEHGLREFPNECCGVVVAREGSPVRVIPMTNIDASPTTYRLDSTEQFRVFETIDQEGLELWAFYHSHTHTEAYPSDTDVRLASFPDTRYVLLSLEDREQPVLRSFFISDGEITEEALSIT